MAQAPKPETATELQQTIPQPIVRSPNWEKNKKEHERKKKRKKHEQVARALYIPPVRSRFLLSAAPAWEELGEHWLESFSGVVMIEATKQLYQMTRMRHRSPARRPMLVPIGGSAARALNCTADQSRRCA